MYKIITDFRVEKLKLITSVELKVEGKNSSVPYDAIVDTGCSDASMSQQLFDSLGYKQNERIETTITGINAKSKGFSTIIDSFIIGGVDLGKTRIAVSKVSPEFENIIVIGMNVLVWFHTAIDYKKNEITLIERRLKNIDMKTRFYRTDIFTRNLLL
ncbi:MAG: retroviral-like aspartic protease family protein [Defluviitaleaceae bacterium]|nr:retroviral-like aspartic protease family protein [Defluviitaleaceae bacterium]